MDGARSRTSDGQPRQRGATRRGAARLWGAAGAVALAAAGCGIGSQGGAPQAGGPMKGVVRLYGWDQEPISSTRRRALDGFRAAHPELSVEQETTSAGGDTYFAKLQALVAGDAMPDMFIVQDSWLPFFLKNKLAMNLDPLVKRDKYDLADFPKGAIDAYRYQGGLYGLPDNITSHGFFVNLELFKQAGVAPPPVKEDTRGWTFDTLVQRLQQVTARVKTDPPIFGITPNYSLAGWLAWVRSNGGELLAKDGGATALNSAGAVEALQLLADLRHKYQLAPTPDQMQGANVNELFERGRVAIHEICVCQVARFRQNAQFEWDAGFRPAGKAGLTDHLFAYPQLLAGPSRNPDAAWGALKWFEDEGMKVLVQAGALQGTRMNAHQRAIFLDPKQKPAHADLWVASVEKFGRVPPATTNWNDVDVAIGKELTPLFNGERTARDAVQGVKRTVDPLVAAGRWG